MSKLSVAGFILLCAFLAIFWQYTENQKLRVANADLAAQLEKTPAIQRTLDARVRAAQNEAKTLQQLLAQREERARTGAKRSSGSAENTSAGDPDSPNAAALVKHWLATMEDKEVMQQANINRLAQIKRRYLPLFKQLSLSPETANSLAQLLVDRKDVSLDAAIAVVKSGGDPIANPELTANAIAAQQELIASQIKQLLGDPGYDDFISAEQSLGQSNVVTMLQKSLEYANTPLSDSQLLTVQQALEANHVGHLNDKIVQSIIPSLTPAQAQALQDFYAQQQIARNAHRMRTGQLQGMATGQP
ncbi:MAG: hypothetical protein ABI273_03690 [Lacunisphaera sp.]